MVIFPYLSCINLIKPLILLLCIKYLLYIQNSENYLLLTSFHSLTWLLHQGLYGKMFSHTILREKEIILYNIVFLLYDLYYFLIDFGLNEEQ